MLLSELRNDLQVGYRTSAAALPMALDRIKREGLLPNVDWESVMPASHSRPWCPCVLIGRTYNLRYLRRALIAQFRHWNTGRQYDATFHLFICILITQLFFLSTLELCGTSLSATMLWPVAMAQTCLLLNRWT